MSSKILVVDDEPDLEDLIVQRFRRNIREGEYEFKFARDGAEALEVLEADPDIDIVLCDINMPRMDGLTLLGHLGEMKVLLRAVIVSAYGDMANIRTAMNRGAFDFVTKPIDFEDLHVTIEKTLADLAVLRDAIGQRAIAERAKENLSRYFPASLVETLANTDEPFGPPREQNVAVLFVDIIGFTSLSAQQTPKNVFSLLRVVLSRLAAEVFAHGGTLDKYIGDAIMAVFGAPFVTPDDPDNAAQAAVEMLECLRAFNSGRKGKAEPRLSIGVGISSGTVVAGTIGSIKRMDYTVIGDGVNLAARLESACKQYGAQILISENTLNNLRGTYRSREVDRVIVKGKTQPVGVYEVLDFHTAETFPNLAEVLGHFREGLAKYRAQRWDDAIATFETALRLNENDFASKMYIERCAQLRETPPGDDWSGIWTMTSK